MGVYQQGQAIEIREYFTLAGAPTNPTTVTFYVRDPYSVVTAYVMGVAPEVTNPAVGTFVLALNPPTISGDYFYRCQGTGVVQAACEGEFTVLASSVLTPTTTDPVLGPCQVWCDGQDVAAAYATGVGSDWSLLTPACEVASEILYELSGQQYSGICQPVTVRPCNDSCGCWGDLLTPMSPGAPQISWGAWGAFGWGWGWGGCDALCGCGSLSRAVLPDYPVVEIVTVKVDGVVVASSNYRLDDWKYLTALADANDVQQYWPSCQRLDLADTEPGTWSVTYRAGQIPPLTGRMAAAQLAFQIWKSTIGAGDCLLPAGVTQVTRQGITVERAPFTAWGIKSGSWSTGMPLVDAFLSVYNPAGLTRRSTVWSPDVQQTAVVLG